MIRPRIGGHPIHIMLVHFPSALYPMAAICSSSFYFTGNVIPGYVAFYAMAAGAATGWLAALFGSWDSAFVSLRQTKIITIIAWHATLNATVTILFTVWAVRAWNEYPHISKDSTLLLVIKWISIGLLFAGNYFGGKLLLKHRVGLPDDEKEGTPATIINPFDA